MNDARTLRARHEALAADVDAARAARDELGSAAYLARTAVDGHYPTTASVFYAVIPVDVSGTEAEGQAASYVARGSTHRYALNIGTQVPPQGTVVVCHDVGGRDCFRYDG